MELSCSGGSLFSPLGFGGTMGLVPAPFWFPPTPHPSPPIPRRAWLENTRLQKLNIHLRRLLLGVRILDPGPLGFGIHSHHSSSLLNFASFLE